MTATAPWWDSFLTMKNKSKKAMSDDLKIMCEYLPKSMRFKTKSERLVCAVMMFYANKHKDNGFEFSIPMVEIAKITCISKYTVCNAVKKLVDDGVFDVVCKGNSVSKKATLYRLNQTIKPNSRVVDSQVVTDDIELFGNGNVESSAKPNSNQTVKPNSRVVDTQCVTDDIELFGETDEVEHKLDPKFKYKYNYKKYDNKEYGLTTINDNKRNDRIGDVNNVSFERLLNVLERLVVSVDEMNRNIEELKTIVSQHRETVDDVKTTNHQGENEIEQPKKGVDTDRESNVSEVETTSPFLSQPIEVIKKEISWEELDRNPHTANTQPAQITTSTSKGVGLVSNSYATEDDINDAIRSIALKTTNQSSKQENITNLWNELRGGDNHEQAYSQLEELFNRGSLTDRQWETTKRIRNERLDAVKTTSNQKKEKKKTKVGDTPNKTLMYFPQEKMNEFNDGVLTFYNACKTALEQERNEGKSFDEEKYIKAFNLYAQNFMELSNATDDDGNRYGDYNYIKSKVYMNPFTDKCNADTRAICERYQTLQAKRQEVVNA